MTFLRTLVQDYGYIHTGISVIGNMTFFIGSIFFLPALEAFKTLGVWLFIIGSFLMLVGALGDLAVKIYDAREDRRTNANST